MFDICSIVFIAITVFCVICTISHLPARKAPPDAIEEIKRNGLIHFTSKKNAVGILHDKYLKGKLSHMGGIELKFGELVWTYPSGNDNLIENKHNILLNKKKGKDNANYKVCLKLTGFSEEDLNRFYMRPKFGIFQDQAIIFRGDKLVPSNIEIVKEWN